MAERECIHDWEAPGAWGVIIGASKCKRCGKVSQSSDFPDAEECDPGGECGRWIDGRLGPSCTLAGTEFCDWECPYSR